MYFRTSRHTMFLLPTIAIGTDMNDLPFLEIVWLFWAIGIGAKV